MAGIAPKYYYLTLGLLAVCVIVGLYIAYSFQREVNEDLGPTTEKDLLDPLEKAYYSGLMDEDEFRRIQESLGKGKDFKPSGKRPVSRAKAAQVPSPTAVQEEPEAPPAEDEAGSPPPSDPTA